MWLLTPSGLATAQQQTLTLSPQEALYQTTVTALWSSAKQEIDSARLVRLSNELGDPARKVAAIDSLHAETGLTSFDQDL